MRTYTLEAKIHFELIDDDEYTDLHTKAAVFATAQSGSYELDASSDGVKYLAQLKLKFSPADRAEAATLMVAIDGALPTLPDLYYDKGPALRYILDEREVPDVV